GGRVLVFFFQAEDGIRDWSVTGVQTCALPISVVGLLRRRLAGGGQPGIGAERFGEAGVQADALAGQQVVVDGFPDKRMPERISRSEERRVGKECRDRGGTAARDRESEATQD